MSRLGHQISQEEFRRIGKKLRAKAVAFGIPTDEVGDLVQETFLHAQKALNEDQFAGLSALDTWIVGIGKMRFLKNRRAKNTAMRKADEVSVGSETDSGAHLVLEGAEPTPEAAASSRQRLRLALEGIGRLPAKLREPLVLVASGRGYKEVASRLGIAPRLVASRLHQARERLRKELPRSVGSRTD